MTYRPGTPPVAGRPAAITMPRTILLADDHEDNRLALLTVLEREGYRTLGAANGQQAVEVAREHMPDLILMDLAMPVMDGRQAMQRLRADPRTAGIPIVVLTAMALTVDRERLVAEGFDGLLIKPCMPPHLVAEVRRVVGPPED
jgi:two-component system cell cycle response regulator DivK